MNTVPNSVFNVDTMRLDKLREYLADELKQAIPSMTYINDLQDSIKAIEYRMGLGQKTFEMVNGKAVV